MFFPRILRIVRRSFAIIETIMWMIVSQKWEKGRVSSPIWWITGRGYVKNGRRKILITARLAYAMITLEKNIDESGSSKRRIEEPDENLRINRTNIRRYSVSFEIRHADVWIIRCSKFKFKRSWSILKKAKDASK